MQWEHSFGNAADDLIDGLPVITRYCIVKNLYEEMFTKVIVSYAYASMGVS